MTIPAYGFDNADLTESGHARLHRVAGTLAWHHGVTSGFNVTVGTGTRALDVGSGTAMAPGIRIDSAATVTVNPAANAGSVNRIDIVAIAVDWVANTATVVVVQGGAAAPALTQTEGTLWQIPLARITVRPGVTTFLASDIALIRPLARRVYLYEGTPTASTSRSANNAPPVTVVTISVADPGWPYRLDASAALVASGPGGGIYGAVLAYIVVGSTTIATGLSSSNPAWMSAATHGVSGTLTGASTVLLRWTVREGGTAAVPAEPWTKLVVRVIPA